MRSSISHTDGGMMWGTVDGQGEHVFGQHRPSTGGDLTLPGEQVRDTHFRGLPEPSGPAPFHLDIKRHC